jgi:hypothetical protein
MIYLFLLFLVLLISSGIMCILNSEKSDGRRFTLFGLIRLVSLLGLAITIAIIAR